MAVVFVIAIVLYTAAAAATDWRMHRIPNYLTVPAAALGLAYHTLAPAGWGPWVSLAGFALGFGLLLIPWLCGGGGMGDVKLLAALGAWLGPFWVLVAFALGAVMAAAMALAIMFSGGMRRTLERIKRQTAPAKPLDGLGRRRPPRILPFAVPVAMGTWVVLAWLCTRGGL